MSSEVNTDAFVEQIKADMRTALKSQDKPAVAVLRSLLARFSNAEAVPTQGSSKQAAGAIAGASPGVGSTEAARRTLTLDDLKELVREEIAEMQSVAAQLDPVSEYSQELQHKIGILQRYITH